MFDPWSTSGVLVPFSLRLTSPRRLLLLSGFRKPVSAVPLTYLDYGGRTSRQYAGVFSGKHIDHATQFLLTAYALERLLYGCLDG